MVNTGRSSAFTEPFVVNENVETPRDNKKKTEHRATVWHWLEVIRWGVRRRSRTQKPKTKA